MASVRQRAAGSNGWKYNAGTMKRSILFAIVDASIRRPPYPAPIAPIVSGQAPASSSGADDEGSMPWVHFEEGKPVDRRPTEKKDNTPAFPEQTRAPYRKTAPFKITT